MSDVHVRRAGPDDAEALVRAHERGWDASVGEIVGRRLGELAPVDVRVERARGSLESPPGTPRRGSPSASVRSSAWP